MGNVTHCSDLFSETDLFTRQTKGYEMQSQIAWGILLFSVGLFVTFILGTVIPFLFLYGIPLVVIGAALIIFRKREEIIEEAAD